MYRDKLYTRLPVWLEFINSSNGYTNTLKGFYKGRVPASSNNVNFNTWYYLAEGAVKETDEAETSPQIEMTLYIGIQYKSEKKEGAITDLGESLVKDVYKWFYRGTGITANKWFFPVSELSDSDLVNHQGQTMLSIIPYPNFNDNTGELLIEIKLRYELAV